MVISHVEYVVIVWCCRCYVCNIILFQDEEESEQLTSGSADIASHMRLYDPVKKGLEVIKTNVAAVEKLKAKNKTTANEKARKEVMNQLGNTFLKSHYHYIPSLSFRHILVTLCSYSVP